MEARWIKVLIRSIEQSGGGERTNEKRGKGVYEQKKRKLISSQSERGFM